MYGDITYEQILQRMIARVLEQTPGIDTREGSLVYNALAPAAVEIKNMYISLDTVVDESFADTQSRDYLIRRCAERGIVPYPATRALLKGEFRSGAAWAEIPVGSRFTLGKVFYCAQKCISPGIYEMRCETAGDAGNRFLGALVPVEYMDGLTEARLVGVLTPGEDEETQEALRGRYFADLDGQAFGGNIADYKAKVGALNGVGGVKVYPAWDGGGTVKVVFLNSMLQKPGLELVQEVQIAVDPVLNQGAGLGIAPIGHVVTVAPAGETIIDMELHIIYQGDLSWADVEPYAEAAIDRYFAELSEQWAGNEAIVVRKSQIESRLLDVYGISDVWDALLNGAAQNITLNPDNIPKRGGITVCQDG